MRKKIFFWSLILILMIIISSLIIKDGPLPSKGYNAIMRSDYRPVIDKDKINLQANLNLVKESISEIKDSCKINLQHLETEIVQKENIIKSLSFKNFVFDINSLKKEIFFLNREVNKIKRNCQEKDDLFYQKSTTYKISSHNFTTSLNLQNEELIPYFVKIENTGKKTVKPKLIINNQDLTSMKSIADNIVNNGMSDREKALAIWQFVKDSKYAFGNPTTYVERDSLDLINSWGYGNCGFTSRVIVDLAILSGLPAREHRLGLHIVPEIYFDGNWHVLDGDGGVYFTKADGTIASVEDIENDINLLKTANSTVYTYEYFEKSYNTVENNIVFEYKPRDINKKIEYELRSQESVIFMNSNRGDYFSGVVYKEPPEYSNSYFIYKPEGEINLLSFSYPYPIVGGEMKGESISPFKVYISRDNKAWKEVYEGSNKFKFDFSRWFRNGFGEPDQTYFVKFDGKVTNLEIITEVQIATKALPLPEKGEINKIEFQNEFGDSTNTIVSFGFADN